MLCYVTRRSTWAFPNAEDVKQGVIAYKIAAHAADVARHARRATATTALLRALPVRLEQAVRAVARPGTARAMHDETLPRFLQEAKFWLDVRAQVLLMNATQLAEHSTAKTSPSASRSSSSCSPRFSPRRVL